MSKVRIPMKNVKIILRMYFVDNCSMRKIAARTGTPYSTVHDNIATVKAKGLTWQQIEDMSEEVLESILSTADNKRPLPDWAYIEKELKRSGVTLQLLWQEHKATSPDGYQYSRFCEMFEAWCKNNDVFTPISHKAGEELYVDYAGDKMSYICPTTGTLQKAEIFVAVLGASDRIYAEASKSQQLPCWIESNINAFEYNGGVTELVIPDNLKSAVTRSDRYEPSINRVYEEMGNHYNTFVAPARVLKPKDKSKVEQGVQSVQREILAPMRNQTFFGLEALNVAIRERLSILNNRPFQKRNGSRESIFLEIEKPMLRPLPETRYSYREWFVALPVGQDHHILVQGHSYSVPFQHARMKVDVALDNKLLEIFFKGQVIARHCRSFVNGERTTLRDHMPPKYQHWFDSLDKDKLLDKARKVGSSTVAWVEAVFSLKGRPPRLLLHTVQGALTLAKEFGTERLDAICERALNLKIHSYKSLKSMLVNGADRQPLPLQGSIHSHLPQCHENVRGAEHFE
jgi:transposase